MHHFDRIARRARRLRPSVIASAGGVLAAVAMIAGIWGGPAPAAARGTRALPGPVPLHSGELTVMLNARTYQVLTQSSRGTVLRTRALVPIKPATSTHGTFAFPLIYGRVNLLTFTGTALSRGGIEFDSVMRPGTGGQDSLVQFKLQNLELQLSTSPVQLTATFLGQHTYHNLPIATLAIGRAQSSHRGHNVRISGLVLKLLATGAQLFNQQAFANQLQRFKAGETVGSVTLAGTS